MMADNGQQAVWKTIEGWGGLYQASNTGFVRSLDRMDANGILKKGRVLKGQKTNRGYLIVGLHLNGESKSASVHKLVATTFFGAANGLDVNHKDGNKENNNIENLEYVTRKQNIRHSWDTGLAQATAGEKSPASKLKETQVKEIRDLLAQGLSLVKIGRLYGVGAATISDIKLGRTWAVKNG